MRKNSEIILLDAVVRSVIGSSAFEVELENGHCLTAFLKRPDRDRSKEVAIGHTVTLEMSPYDMSKGCIVLK